MNNITIRHSLPNRVRFEMPLIRNNEKVAGIVEEVAKEAEGIFWARINLSCASVTVRFDAQIHDSESLIGLFSDVSKEVQ